MGSFRNTSGSQTNQTGNQSGTTQNNIWNNQGLQDFLGRFGAQSNGAQFNVGLNNWQTGAADRLAQQGSGQGLENATGTANNIASNGFANQINAFQNPYQQQVINGMLQDFGTQNQQTRDAHRGRMAAQGALGNQTGSDALVMQGQQDAQARALAQAHHTGFTTSADLANRNAGQQLQGAGALGQMFGLQTGANNAAYQAGLGNWNSMFQNASAQNNQWGQNADVWGRLGGLAGQNYSGNTSGNSNMQGWQDPSRGSIFAGLAGTAMSMLPGLASTARMFSDERVKENVKPIGETFDGQPIYKYNLIGSPKTQIGLMAQDVEEHTPEAVGSRSGIKTVDYDRATRSAEHGGRADGGLVMGAPGKPFHEKVAEAFQAFGKMRASGGRAETKGYDDGGWVTSVNRDATSAWSPNYTAMGRSLGNMGQQLGTPQAQPTNNPGADALARDQASLGSQLARMLAAGQASGSSSSTARPQGMAEGGVPDYAGAGTLIDFVDWTRPGQYRFGMHGTPSNPDAPRPEVASNPFAQFGLGHFGAVQPRAEPEPLAAANVNDAPLGFNPSTTVTNADFAPAPPPSTLGGPPPRTDNVIPGAPPPQGQDRPWWSPSGIWAGERATPWQNIGAALMRVGNGPFAPMGEHIQQMSAQQIQQRQLERAIAHEQAQLAHQRSVLTESTRHHTAVEDQGNWRSRPDGTMINARTGETRGSPEDLTATRRRQWEQATGQPGRENDPTYRRFLLTGQMGSGQLSPSQEGRIVEAENQTVAGQTALTGVTEALRLNGRAYSGSPFGLSPTVRAAVANVGTLGIGTQGSVDTNDLGRLMMGSVLANLRNTFGGNPSDGERRVLTDVEAAVNATVEERARILRRAEEAIKLRLELNERRVREMREGTYFQSTQPPSPRTDPNIPVIPPGSLTALPNPPPDPTPGTVVDGYRFKGGDPSVRDNWERVN